MIGIRFSEPRPTLPPERRAALAQRVVDLEALDDEVALPCLCERTREPHVLPVAQNPRDGLLAERHDAFLAALAEHAHDAGIERNLAELEPDEVRDARSRRIQRFVHRAVAHDALRLDLRRGEQCLDLRLSQVLREQRRATGDCASPP
jgi:hypothetical protein